MAYRAVALAACAAAARAHSAAVDFEFPKQFRWTFRVELPQEKVSGTGQGVIDWTADEDQPRYWAEQRYHTEAHSADFKVTRDRVSGDRGVYTYAFATADGTSACLPAAFTAFPRKMFSKETWTGTVDHKGQACSRYVAAAPGSGTPGSLELLACDGVPVMTKWVSATEGGLGAEQVAYTTAYEPFTEATAPTDARFLRCDAAAEAGRVPEGFFLTEEVQPVSVVVQAELVKVNAEAEVGLKLAASEPTVDAGGAAKAQVAEEELKEAYRILTGAKAEIETWKEVAKKAVGAGGAAARAVATEEAVKGWEEEKERIEREAEGKSLAAEAAYEKKVQEIVSKKFVERHGGLVQAEAGDAAQQEAVAGNLRQAWAGLQEQKRLIGAWEVKAKEAADAQHDAAAVVKSDASAALAHAEREYSRIDREAEAKLDTAFRAYAAAVAAVEEAHPAAFYSFVTSATTPVAAKAAAPSARPAAQMQSASLFYFTFAVSLTLVGFAVKRHVLSDRYRRL